MIAEVPVVVEKNDIDPFQSDIGSMRHTLKELTNIFRERDRSLEMTMICLIARQHGLFYGLGGSGKSDMIRNLAQSIDHVYFEYLLSQFSTLDELYGPWDLVGMREHGQMVRVVDGMLPEAEIAFLDEIGNSSSPIRNALKNLLNERQYNFGRTVRFAPLESAFAASNSVLEYEDATEAAFEDRFLARMTVKYLEQDNNIAEVAMMYRNGRPAIPKMSREIIRRLQGYARSIQLTRGIADIAVSLRKQIAADSAAGNLIVSDRRFNQTFDLAAAHAIYSGRKTIKKSDLIVFAYTFWKNPDDENKLYQYVKQQVDTAGSKIQSVLDAANQILQAFTDSQSNVATASSAGSALQYSVMTRANLEGQMKAVERLRRSAEDEEEVEQANEAEKEIKRMLAQVEKISLDLADEDGVTDYDNIGRLKKVR
jgi:MoxR-like ATPase